MEKQAVAAYLSNQLREKIGVMFEIGKQLPDALKFYASLRMDIRRTSNAIKDKDGNILGTV